jgi:hypothetical protein
MMNLDEFKEVADLVGIYEKLTEELIKIDGERPKDFIQRIKKRGAKKELLSVRAEIAREVSPIVELRI